LSFKKNLLKDISRKLNSPILFSALKWVVYDLLLVAFATTRNTHHH